MVLVSMWLSGGKRQLTSPSLNGNYGPRYTNERRPGLKKGRSGGKKLQIFNRQLQIID